MKLKKKIPLIDQHNKNGFWGGKFGGNFIPETLKKPRNSLPNSQKISNRKKNQKKRSAYKFNVCNSSSD